MNEIKTLMEKFWIERETDKELYYSVKHVLNDRKFRLFIQQKLGWRLIHTEKLLKLEKRPAHAETFMGIQEFMEIRDYCILCAVLIFLEDMEENTQFLLSELIRNVETVMKDYMECDWTDFGQRKSLVRVLQYAEKMHMIRVYDGNSSVFAQEMTTEVLYINTGISKFFATSHTVDISEFKGWQDFENAKITGIEDNRGEIRTNRVFRQLVTCPALYWADQTDADAVYLRNERTFIEKMLSEMIGGKIVLSRNSASLVYIDEKAVGDVHPREGMLGEIVLLVCRELCEMAQDARRLTVLPDDRIVVTDGKFNEILLRVRKRYLDLFSKEYREMNEERYIERVRSYMKSWMMIQEDGSRTVIYPVCALTGGGYSAETEKEIHE